MRDEGNMDTGKKGRRRKGKEGKGKEMQVQYIFPETPRTLKGNQLVPCNNDLSSFSANRCVLPLTSLSATVSSKPF